MGRGRILNVSHRKWIKRMGFTSARKYYSTIKAESLPFATTWMKPQYTILSERN